MTRYLGGLITKDESLVLPANNFEDTSAPGVWTLEEAQALNKQGLWPTAGNTNPAKFVENIFSVDTYTGDGSTTQTVTTGIDTLNEGGLIWIKDRDNNISHGLFDTARGVNQQLLSNTNGASEDGSTHNNRMKGFLSNGFQVGDGDFGGSNRNYVAWTFRKAPKFFDVVQYTGDGNAGRTVSHSLGTTPGMIIIKKTDGAASWMVWHRSLTNTTTKALYLDTTNAELTNTNYWNSTAPTSTTLTLGSHFNVNYSGSPYIAYFFAHDTSSDGLIQCGSVDIDGSNNATVDLGFEPQWFLGRTYTSAADWEIHDTLRGWSEGRLRKLHASGNDAETNYNAKYNWATNTGFQTSGYFSGSQTLLYVAVRRGPMQTPTSRASVFEVDERHSGDPNYTTTFPVDMAINPTTAGGNVRLTSRRLGNKKLLVDNAGSLEGGDSGQDYAHNDGVNLVDSSTYYAFMWRRAPKFFDYVRYDGNGSNRTIEHALGVTPEMIWVKNMTAYGQDWGVYYGDATDYLKLNSDAATADDNTFWNDTAPTSTVFTVGTHDSVNKNTNDHIAYLFATLAGISKIGTFSHTNGSSTDVDCGFSSGSRWVLVKRTDSTSDWYIWDTERGLVSGNDGYLVLNSTAAEVTNQDYIDPLNSGFQIASGFTTGSYMFYAIAA